METGYSDINLPAIAAGRVIKRYQAQVYDELTLEVGEFLSITDMPSIKECIWWRGKKGYKVGFFPYDCIEIIEIDNVTDIALKDFSRPLVKKKGKIVTFLHFLFRSRTSKVEKKGNRLMQKRVFGCDLSARLAINGRKVPLVLQMCCEVIEEFGIINGIYRRSGMLSNLQCLRIEFNSNVLPNLKDPKYLNDIHCISSLLKTYFRELPNPLFTYELYDKFVAAIKKTDDAERTIAFHHVIQRLPQTHYETMHALLLHLNICAEHHRITNMTAKNLAIVWAPNLLRPNSDSFNNILTEFHTHAIVIEYMIRNVHIFFDSTLASFAIAHHPECAESFSASKTKFTKPNINETKLISLEEARFHDFLIRMESKFISGTGECYGIFKSLYLCFLWEFRMREMNHNPNFWNTSRLNG